MYKFRSSAVPNAFNILFKNWFLIGIVLCIFMAKLYPEMGEKGGWLHPEITVRYVAVSIIFFLSGLSLKTQELTTAVLQIRLHAFVQCFTLIFIPIFVQLIVIVLRKVGDVNEWLLKGLVALSCMPPPVSSAVILTKATGGNEGAAIFNSAFGSFLGIFFTPVTLLHFFGATASVPLSSTIWQLLLTVVLPLIIGQIFRLIFSKIKTEIKVGNVGSVMLLFIIYTTFCDTFSREELGVDVTDLIGISLLVLLIQILLLCLCFFVTTFRQLGFSSADTVAIMFCATHKSLTLGIPILKILFGGYDYLSTISIPLLIYHPTQILLGGLIVPYLRTWLRLSTRKHGVTSNI